MSKNKFLLFPVLLVIILVNSCTKKNTSPNIESESSYVNNSIGGYLNKEIYSGFPENFESGSKTSYAAANITLSTGSWNLADALLGTLANDRKNGTKSVRIQNTGTVTMNFDVNSGASEVIIEHGIYGTDASSTWGLWCSTDGGSSWAQVGSNVSTTSTLLASSSFTINVNNSVRFQLRKLSGGRLNIDDFKIIDNVTSTATQDNNMGMGNPSAATTNTAEMNNYLMEKTQYALSYNNSKGIANWVSWHLSTAWLGTEPRCDCFTQDGTLPAGYFKASYSHYTNTGFDRGHQCPSEDRTINNADNAATFKMTNVMPQAPVLNQQTWKDLETYCRTLTSQGNECYIICGSYGQGGSGSLGGTTNTIASGSITVPSNFWKVIVVLPVGSNDVNRVTTSTRIIAVDMPNNQSLNSQNWGYYRTSIDAIEAATGYDFLSLVASNIQSVIEAQVDSGPIQ